MKKTIAIILVVLFALAMTSLSFAAEEKKTTPAPVAKKAEPIKPAVTLKYVTGVVKAVDTVAKTVTVTKKVKGKEVETAVIVDEKTSIAMGKNKKELADVKVGNNVTVKYAEVEGKNVAKSISIKPAKKKAKTATKTK